MNLITSLNMATKAQLESQVKALKKKYQEANGKIAELYIKIGDLNEDNRVRSERIANLEEIVQLQLLLLENFNEAAEITADIGEVSERLK